MFFGHIDGASGQEIFEIPADSGQSAWLQPREIERGDAHVLQRDRAILCVLRGLAIDPDHTEHRLCLVGFPILGCDQRLYLAPAVPVRKLRLVHDHHSIVLQGKRPRPGKIILCRIRVSRLSR